MQADYARLFKHELPKQAFDVFLEESQEYHLEANPEVLVNIDRDDVKQWVIEQIEGLNGCVENHNGVDRVVLHGHVRDFEIERTALHKLTVMFTTPMDDTLADMDSL